MVQHSDIDHTGLPGVPGGGAGTGGDELAYAEFTAPVSVTGTTVGGAQSIVSAGAVVFDGSTPVIIAFFAPSVQPGGSIGAQLNFHLLDGGTDIGHIAQVRTPDAGSSFIVPVNASRKLTPSAASHTYSIVCYRVTANGTVTAGAGGAAAYMPGYIRITDAS